MNELLNVNKKKYGVIDILYLNQTICYFYSSACGSDA